MTKKLTGKTFEVEVVGNIKKCIQARFAALCNQFYNKGSGFKLYNYNNDKGNKHLLEISDIIAEEVGVKDYLRVSWLSHSTTENNWHVDMSGQETFYLSIWPGPMTQFLDLDVPEELYDELMSFGIEPNDPRIPAYRRILVGQPGDILRVSGMAVHRGVPYDGFKLLGRIQELA